MRNGLRVFFGILIVCGLATRGSAQLGNVVKGVQVGVGKGLDIVKDTPKFVPSISEIGTLGKEWVFAAAPALILETLNTFCRLALETEGDVKRSEDIVPELQNISLILLDSKYNKSFGIDNIDELLNFETFNKDYPVVILTTGWLSMVDNQTNGARESIYGGYKCRGNTNFILFDSADYITSIYLWSAKNTATLGQFLAEFVLKMSETIPLERFHLIGHSLGAQISGEAGRHFQLLSDKQIPRITGLDAARPCFNEGETLNGVGRGDAEFVDLIHTNNGALGIRSPAGDADFYPNGVLSLQPGSFDISSSHSRAYEYYGESVYPGAENSFMARKCNSYYSYKRDICKGKEIPMGFATPQNTKGNFILKTESKAPYGQAKINSCGGAAASDQSIKSESAPSSPPTLSSTSTSTDGPSSSSTTPSSSGSTTGGFIRNVFG